MIPVECHCPCKLLIDSLFHAEVAMHAGVTELASSLAVMTHLEKVVLLGYRISGWPVQVLSAALANLRNLESLELELGSVTHCWSSSNNSIPSSRCNSSFSCRSPSFFPYLGFIHEP
jgi:hypothetical protein